MDFIKHLKMQYDDGIEILMASSLMDFTLNHYHQSVQAGTWKAKTPKQEQLISYAHGSAEGHQFKNL